MTLLKLIRSKKHMITKEQIALELLGDPFNQALTNMVVASQGGSPKDKALDAGQSALNDAPLNSTLEYLVNAASAWLRSLV